MPRKLLFAVTLLLLVIVPVLITQLLPTDSRSFRSVLLEELQYTEVDFLNVEQEIELAGMLFVPQGEGPFPAVVVIHGSGTSFRENRWYLTLTDYLQSRGVVVLLPDKRGSVHSGGDWRSASFEDLATDTLAAVRYLVNTDAAVIGDIGIVGMSQGGWIAPLVADRSEEIDFVVSFVGAAVTPTEQLLFEENHNLQQIGFLPGISNVIALMSTTYIRKVGQRPFWDAVGDYDPLPYWGRLDVDALALFGRDDTNVPSEESVARLESLANPHIRIKMYEDSGHALESPVGRGDSIIRQEVLEDIVSFIRDVAASLDEPAN